MSELEDKIVENSMDTNSDKPNMDTSIEQVNKCEIEQNVSVNSNHSSKTNEAIIEEETDSKMKDESVMRQEGNLDETESEQFSEMDANSKEIPTNDKRIVGDEQKKIVEENPSDSNVNINPKEKVITEENDTKMETQNSNDYTGNESKQPQPPIRNSIGSLGLLNQYTSSSDENESDTSSGDENDDDDDSDSGNNTTGSSSNTEVPDTNVAKDKELNTSSNGILNSTMSRENYREAESYT